MKITFEFDNTEKEVEFLQFLRDIGLPDYPTKGDFFRVNRSNVTVISTNPYSMSGITKQYIFIEAECIV